MPLFNTYPYNQAGLFHLGEAPPNDRKMRGKLFVGQVMGPWGFLSHGQAPQKIIHVTKGLVNKQALLLKMTHF